MNDYENIKAARMRYRQLKVCPKRFVFYDKGTGTERFEIKAGLNGSMPVEQAASLMAIHCLTRGTRPKDFGVMIAAEEDLVGPLVLIAKRLVSACGEGRRPFDLTHRQREVLRALLEEASNKEIAAKLNVSVRTVKFHLSTLFAKFNVHSRISLMRKAADVLLSEVQQDSIPAVLLRADGQPAMRRESVQPLRVISRQRASR